MEEYQALLDADRQAREARRMTTIGRALAGGLLWISKQVVDRCRALPGDDGELFEGGALRTDSWAANNAGWWKGTEVPPVYPVRPPPLGTGSVSGGGHGGSSSSPSPTPAEIRDSRRQVAAWDGYDAAWRDFISGADQERWRARQARRAWILSTDPVAREVRRSTEWLALIRAWLDAGGKSEDITLFEEAWLEHDGES